MTVGRLAATVAIILAIVTARPLLGNSNQAFQYIQEYTGFFTPGITVIFLLGLFWPKASEAGAIAGTLTSFAASLLLKAFAPTLPFLDRMGLVFLCSLGLAVVVSLARPQKSENFVITSDVAFATRPTFNIAAVGVIAIVVAFYATWW